MNAFISLLLLLSHSSYMHFFEFFYMAKNHSILLSTPLNTIVRALGVDNQQFFMSEGYLKQV